MRRVTPFIPVQTTTINNFPSPRREKGNLQAGHILFTSPLSQLTVLAVIF